MIMRLLLKREQHILDSAQYLSEIVKKEAVTMSMKDKFKNFFNMEEEYEYVEEYTDDSSTQAQPSAKKEKGKNVVNLSAIQQPVSKVMLCEPTSYNEVQEIADNLLNKRAVVNNLKSVD